jgi:chorismate synthase
MVHEIEAAGDAGDSLGGVFEVIAYGVIPGLGSYVQADRRIDGRIAGAIMSIPAIKGVEIGDGFAVAKVRGSQAHDEIFIEEGELARRTDRAGSVEGGVTAGGPLRVRAAMKPLSTLKRPLQTVDLSTGEPAEAFRDRTDVCSVPAAGVVGESVVALVLADAVLEKFGSDSLIEIKEAISSYQDRIDQTLHRGRGETK